MNSRLLSLCLFLLMVLLSGCSDDHFIPKQPTASNGILDLSYWDIHKNNVNLSGDWKFYWNRLLEPEDLESKNIRANPMKIPGLWSSLVIDGNILPNTGYGTLQLNIILNNTNEELGLKIYQIGTAYRLWIDGKPLVLCGIVGTNQQSMKGMIKPQVVFFTPQSRVVKVVLQISNYKDRHGGVWANIMMGSKENIIKNNYIDKGLGLVVFGIFLIIGLYYILLFVFSRKEYSLLYFGICSLLTGIETFFYGEVFLMTLFPNFDFEINFRIQYLLMCFATAFFVSFLNTLFPTEIRKIVVKISWVLIMLYCILISLSPLYVYSSYLICFHVYLLLIIIYLIAALIKAVIKKRSEAPIALAALSIFFLTVINDILYSSVIIQTAYTVPYGLVFFALSYIVILSIRISRLHSAANELIQIKNKNEEAINHICEKHALSRREKEVILLLIKGLSYEDISSRLFIAVSTLQKHIHSIYRKFGVKNRLELNYFIQTGRKKDQTPNDPVAS